jgi:hypothetical protein
MAVAAAPYLHARLSTIGATLSPAVAEPEPKPTSVVVEFIVPGARHPRDGQTEHRWPEQSNRARRLRRAQPVQKLWVRQLPVPARRIAERRPLLC